MKKAHLIAPLVVVVLCANLAWAQTSTGVQEGTGGSGGDTSSAGYQAKTAVADPAVGTSQSDNYIYDHGTLWLDEGAVEVPPVIPSPKPTGGGGGGGASSGSGWLSSLFGGNPPNLQIGGVAPDIDVPFTDTPAVTEVMKALPKVKPVAVRIKDVPAVVEYAVTHPQSEPKIIRLVGDDGVVRAIDIVLLKRIMPWPLWIALLLIILGGAVLVIFAAGRGVHLYLLWIAGGLILVGVIIGIVVRVTYRLVPIDTRAITSISVVPVREADMAVKKLMEDLPIGVHVIEATDAEGKEVLTVKAFITPALPI